MYPANLAGVPDALIFFCLLFFHQGKKRSTGAILFIGEIGEIGEI